MTIEEFKNKYEQMKDSNIYKSYCSVLENKDLILRKTLKEKQELIEFLKEEQDRLARECSHIYEDSLGRTRLVSEDIYNEVSKILSKIEKSDK